ncbi:MAG: hypothetical protein QXP03_02790 [Desulfurococcaceae archaeon]
MKNIALFFDYDGVLAPITPSPLSSGVYPELISVIKSLQNEGFKVAVISGRDCPFLYEKVPGLDGYACVFGLEVHGGGYVVLDEEVYRGVKPRAIEDLASKVKTILGDRVGAIFGRTLTGVPLGMSVYWFKDAGKPANLEVFISEALARGLVVYDIAEWGNFAEYVDVHVARRSKREAVRVLKALLEVDTVVYFGDTASDIPAFAEADVSVLIRHEFNKDLNIEVDYVIEVGRLPSWVKEMKFGKNLN